MSAGCRNTEHCKARRKWGDGECGCGHPFPPEIDGSKYPIIKPEGSREPRVNDPEERTVPEPGEGSGPSR
jgi:hypothetical protein